MSLRGFHILFIVSSIIIAFGFSYWAFLQYNQIQNTGYLLTACFSLLSAFGLIIYEMKFIKKNA